MKPRNLHIVLAFLSILALIPSAGYAQTRRSDGAALELGAGLGSISAVGDFRRNVGGWNVNYNWAFDFDLILPLSDSGIFRFRLDYFFGNYKKDSTCQSLCFLRGFSLGPELGYPRGPVQPYVNAGYGWPSLGAGGYVDDQVKQRIQDQVHGAGGWILGGGGRIPLGHNKRWAVDIGVRYYRLGESSYLSGEGIERYPDGSFDLITERGEMPFLLFTLGFQYRIFARNR